jgi:hypothetical protein
MSFMDNLSRKVKAKAEEWDVQGKAEKVAAEVDKVAHEVKDKAATYADENRDKVASGLDKAGAKLDERTEGKYADKIVKAKAQVAKGVDKLAEQRPGGPQAPTSGTSGPATAGAWSSATSSPTTGPTTTPQDSYRPDAYTPEPYVAEPIDDPTPIDEEPPISGTGRP